MSFSRTYVCFTCSKGIPERHYEIKQKGVDDVLGKQKQKVSSTCYFKVLQERDARVTQISIQPLI